jgi:putative protease
MEEKRPGQYFPVFEDDRGLYLFHSKDLALYEFLPALARAGVASFKIEGRMKSIHYIASTLAFYRQVIDGKRFAQEEADALLGRIRNRGYSTGFMKGTVTPDDYSIERGGSQGTATFVGNVSKCDEGKRCCIVEVRNKIKPGELYEVLTPDGQLSMLTLPAPLINQNGEAMDVANNSQFIRLDIPLPEYTILRQIINT